MTSARVVVDGQRIDDQTHLPQNRLLDLSTPLLIGGLDRLSREELASRAGNIIGAGNGNQVGGVSSLFIPA